MQQNTYDAWANKYKEKSKEVEYGSFIYSEKVDSQTKYTFGRTYKGNRSNVVLGCMVGYFSGGSEALLKSDMEMVGYIRTHPKPEKTRSHNDFPSTADMILKWFLPGVDEVYIVPYARCYKMPYIIDSSDRPHKDEGDLY